MEMDKNGMVNINEIKSELFIEQLFLLLQYYNWCFE